MTDLQDQLTQIRERAEKATEGPWDFEPDRTMQDGVYPAYVFAEHMAGYPICDVTTTPIPAGDDDATFIAAARNDVPRLLDAVEAVLWHVDLYRQQIESLREPAERYGGYFQGQLAMAEEVVRGLEETMTEKLGAGDDGTD